MVPCQRLCKAVVPRHRPCKDVVPHQRPHKAAVPRCHPCKGVVLQCLHKAALPCRLPCKVVVLHCPSKALVHCHHKHKVVVPRRLRKATVTCQRKLEVEHIPCVSCSVAIACVLHLPLTRRPTLVAHHHLQRVATPRPTYAVQTTPCARDQTCLPAGPMSCSCSAPKSHSSVGLLTTSLAVVSPSCTGRQSSPRTTS